MTREELGKFIHEAYWDIVRKKQPNLRWPTWDGCNGKEDWYIVADKVMEKLRYEKHEESFDTILDRVHNGVLTPEG